MRLIKALPMALASSLLLARSTTATAQTGTSDTGRIVSGRLVSDTFEIHTGWRGDTLLVSIVSDLPDDALVMVGVDRLYWEKGSPDAYSIPYRSEQSTVGAWEHPHAIPVDNEKWSDSLRTLQRTMARIGMGFQVDHISDSVSVSFIVPINQKDPRFGERNSLLTGKVVNRHGLHIVDREVSIAKPLGTVPQSPTWVSGSDLKVGGTYVISESTPLMPSLNPAAPLAALARMRRLPSGSRITVLEIREKGGYPWYHVRATAHDSSMEGWINSIALTNQDIRQIH